VIPETELAGFPLPRKPKLAEPCGATDAFQLTFFAVTVDPDVVCPAFHTWDMDSPLVNVHFTVQPLRAELDWLATVTAAWKPPLHVEVTW